MSENVSRRKFFSMNFEATLGFLGNFIGTQLKQDRDFFRPPGASEELDFLTSCTRCGVCRDSCPESIINLFSFSYGAKLANTPFINPNTDVCTFCQKCIEVCPTEALSSNGLFSFPAVGKAEVIQSRCLTYKDVMCDYCVRTCPANAISLEHEKVVINTSLCNGCGKCVNECIEEEKGIFINTLS